jgi:2-(1,2-epoxy-1,2-dihydrophenyl)acetyl-CoA isomerase
MDIGEFTGFELSLRNPGIAWFQFNTPERLNGMTTRIKRDLIEAVTQAQMDNAVRVLVFTGSGRAFCAGDDLKAYGSAELGSNALVPDIPPGHDSALGTYNGLRTISQQLNTCIRNIDKLTIAAINGVAIQTGFSLALSCDFRLAATTATAGRRRSISAGTYARAAKSAGVSDA